MRNKRIVLKFPRQCRNSKYSFFFFTHFSSELLQIHNLLITNNNPNINSVICPVISSCPPVLLFLINSYKSLMPPKHPAPSGNSAQHPERELQAGGRGLGGRDLILGSALYIALGEGVCVLEKSRVKYLHISDGFYKTTGEPMFHQEK